MLNNYIIINNKYFIIFDYFINKLKYWYEENELDLNYLLEIMKINNNNSLFISDNSQNLKFHIIKENNDIINLNLENYNVDNYNYLLKTRPFNILNIESKINFQYITLFELNLLNIINKYITNNNNNILYDIIKNFVDNLENYINNIYHENLLNFINFEFTENSFYLFSNLIKESNILLLKDAIKNNHYFKLDIKENSIMIINLLIQIIDIIEYLETKNIKIKTINLDFFLIINKNILKYFPFIEWINLENFDVLNFNNLNNKELNNLKIKIKNIKENDDEKLNIEDGNFIHQKLALFIFDIFNNLKEREFFFLEKNLYSNFLKLKDKYKNKIYDELFLILENYLINSLKENNYNIINNLKLKLLKYLNDIGIETKKLNNDNYNKYNILDYHNIILINNFSNNKRFIINHKLIYEHFDDKYFPLIWNNFLINNIIDFNLLYNSKDSIMKNIYLNMLILINDNFNDLFEYYNNYKINNNFPLNIKNFFKLFLNYNTNKKINKKIKKDKLYNLEIYKFKKNIIIYSFIILNENIIIIFNKNEKLMLKVIDKNYNLINMINLDNININVNKINYEYFEFDNQLTGIIIINNNKIFLVNNYITNKKCDKKFEFSTEIDSYYFDKKNNFYFSINYLLYNLNINSYDLKKIENYVNEFNIKIKKILIKNEKFLILLENNFFNVLPFNEKYSENTFNFDQNENLNYFNLLVVQNIYIATYINKYFELILFNLNYELIDKYPHKNINQFELINDDGFSLILYKNNMCELINIVSNQYWMSFGPFCGDIKFNIFQINDIFEILIFEKNFNNFYYFKSLNINKEKDLKYNFLINDNIVSNKEIDYINYKYEKINNKYSNYKSNKNNNEKLLFEIDKDLKNISNSRYFHYNKNFTKLFIKFKYFDFNKNNRINSVRNNYHDLMNLKYFKNVRLINKAYLIENNILILENYNEITLFSLDIEKIIYNIKLNFSVKIFKFDLEFNKIYLLDLNNILYLYNFIDLKFIQNYILNSEKNNKIIDLLILNNFRTLFSINKNNIFRIFNLNLNEFKINFVLEIKPNIYVEKIYKLKKNKFYCYKNTKKIVFFNYEGNDVKLINILSYHSSIIVDVKIKNKFWYSLDIKGNLFIYDLKNDNIINLFYFENMICRSFDFNNDLFLLNSFDNSMKIYNMNANCLFFLKNLIKIEKYVWWNNNYELLEISQNNIKKVIIY